MKTEKVACFQGSFYLSFELVLLFYHNTIYFPPFKYYTA